jgi:hypothetical protein
LSGGGLAATRVHLARARCGGDRPIREFRTALGMTVAELGRQSDLSPADSKIERGLTRRRWP